MRIALAERLPDDAPQLALFDAHAPGIGDRRSTAHGLSPNTLKAYARRYRRYQEWCAEVGYQAAPQFITTSKIRDHVVSLTRLRRSPSTIWQAVRALEFYAEGEGVVVSTEPALGVLDEWRDVLAGMGLAKPRRQRRQRRLAGAA